MESMGSRDWPDCALENAPSKKSANPIGLAALVGDCFVNCPS